MFAKIKGDTYLILTVTSFPLHKTLEKDDLFFLAGRSVLERLKVPAVTWWICDDMGLEFDSGNCLAHAPSYPFSHIGCQHWDVHGILALHEILLGNELMPSQLCYVTAHTVSVFSCSPLRASVINIFTPFLKWLSSKCLKKNSRRKDWSWQKSYAWVW